MTMWEPTPGCLLYVDCRRLEAVVMDTDCTPLQALALGLQQKLDKRKCRYQVCSMGCELVVLAGCIKIFSGRLEGGTLTYQFCSEKGWSELALVGLGERDFNPDVWLTKIACLLLSTGKWANAIPERC